MRHSESPDRVDDDISEYGWPAVREGLHRMGREPTAAEIEAAERKHAPWRFKESTCQHTWVEGAPSFCIACGTPRPTDA